MATLSRQKIVLGGLAVSYSAAAVGGDEADNGDGKLFFHVKNAGVGSINVTVNVVNSSVNVGGYGTASIASQVVAVANGTEKFIGPFPKQAWNNATTDRVSLSYSGVSSVTVAALYHDNV